MAEFPAIEAEVRRIWSTEGAKNPDKANKLIDGFLADNGFTRDTFRQQRLNVQTSNPEQKVTPAGATPPPEQPLTPEQQRIVDKEGAAANFTESALAGYGTEAMATLGALTGYTPEGGYFSSAPALPGGEKWQQLQDLNQKLVEDYRKQNPKTAAGARLLGGAAALPFTRGRTLPAMIGEGMVLGGIEATGEGSGSIGERLSRAPEGMAYGGFAGMLGKPLGDAAGWLMNYGRDLLRQGIDPQVISKIIERLGTMAPEAAQREMQRLGAPGMLADVHPGMQTATAATASVDPGAAETIGRRLQERQDAAPQRLNQHLDRTLGPARDPHVVETDEAANRRVWQPVYRDVAPQYVVDLDPTSQFVLSEIQRVGTGGPYGASLQRIRGMLNDAAGNLRNRGDQAHGLREEIDNMIDTARGARENKLAAQLNQVRNRVDEALKQGVPGMQEADDAYFRSHNRERAYTSGRDEFLDTRVSPGEHYANRQRMTADERQFEQAGLRYELQRRMGAPMQTGQANRAERILGHPFTQEKLTNTVGGRPAQRLTNDIDAEQTFGDTYRHAHPTQGSRTAPVAEVTQQMWGKPPPSGAVGDALTVAGATVTGGVPGGAAAATSVGRRRLGAGARELTERDRTIIQRTADMLTQGPGPARDAFMRAAQQEFEALPRHARRREVAERIAAQLMKSGGTELDRVVGPYVNPPIGNVINNLNRGLQ